MADQQAEVAPQEAVVPQSKKIVVELFPDGMVQTKAADMPATQVRAVLEDVLRGILVDEIAGEIEKRLNSRRIVQANVLPGRIGG